MDECCYNAPNSCASRRFQLDALIRQSLQKDNEIIDFRIIESRLFARLAVVRNFSRVHIALRRLRQIIKFLNRAIRRLGVPEFRIGIARHIKFHGIAQIANGAIVEIGGRGGNVAQRRNLELAAEGLRVLALRHNVSKLVALAQA